MGSASLPLSDDDPVERQLLETEHSDREVERLYRTHVASSELRRACGRSGVDVRDCLHEAFARLLSLSPGRRRGIAHPGAYLRRTSSNLFNDGARAAARRQQLSQELGFRNQECIDQVVILESRDMLRRIEAALATLKPKTRAIFLAHRIDGLSYAEIAAQTGLTVKGVEKQMSKAIAKISRLLDRP